MDGCLFESLDMLRPRMGGRRWRSPGLDAGNRRKDGMGLTWWLCLCTDVFGVRMGWSTRRNDAGEAEIKLRWWSAPVGSNKESRNGEESEDGRDGGKMMLGKARGR